MRSFQLPSRLTFGLIVIAALSAFLPGCGRSVLPEALGPNPTVDGGGSGANLVGLAVSPSEIQMALGDELRMTATATFDDGTVQDVTGLSTWSSSNPGIVGIDDAGIALAISGGDANITASFEGLSSSALLSVIDESNITGIEMVPPVLDLPIGGVGEMSVIASLSDGSTQDVTTVAVIELGDPEVASFDAGTVTALEPGMTEIAASLGAFETGGLIRVSDAELVSIRLEPGSATTAIATALSFTATGVYDDGSTSDLSEVAGWSVESPSIARINDSGRVTGISEGETVVFARYMGLEGRADLTVTGAMLEAIEVSPLNPTLGTGEVQRFTATAIYSDGTRVDVSADATWSSTEPRVASVTADGQVSTATAGETTITAAFGGRRGASTVTVTGSALERLVIEPRSLELGLAEEGSLRAFAEYSDGTRTDVTESASWASSDAATVSVSTTAGSRGRVSSIALGTATITARFETVSATATVEVNDDVLELIAITPDTATTGAGGTVEYRAVGRYFDGTSRTYRDITASVTWSVRAATVASVSNAAGTQGVASGIAEGTTTVTATLGSISDTAELIVTGASLSSIRITPADATTTEGLRTNYRAEAVYSDGSTADITASAMWSTSSTRVASVSNAAGIEGQLLALDAGRTRVIATFEGVMGSTTLTVLEPTPVELQVTPVGGTVAVGDTIQYQAVIVYSNGTSRNVTRMAMWSSSSTRTATIMSGGRGGGRATGVAAGTSSIRASFDGLTGAQTLTVNSAALVSISVTPATWSTTVGETRQFQAQAIYSDGSTANVTAAGTWTSSNASVAEVSNAFRSWGRVTTTGSGSATITLTYMGLSGTASVTVSGATISSIQVTPFAPSLAAGRTVQFQAVAIYSDGSSSNITRDVTWTSSNSAIAQASNAFGSWGRTTAIGPGTATITASYMSVTGSTTVTVTAATIDRIQVTPFIPTLPLGVVLPMQAVAIYTDGSTVTVTNMATWTSSAPATAEVSNARFAKGQVTPLAAGRAEISATYDGATGSTTVTVTAAALSSITVTPGTASVGVGGSAPFIATGTYADGASFDLTAFVTWSTDDVTVADVSNAFGSWGRATGFSAGRVRIIATFGATTGFASLTVM